MKLKLSGFSWALPGVADPEDFCKKLAELNGEQFKFRGHRRYVCTGNLEGYFVGAILTLKSNRKYTTLQLENLSVHVNSHKEDEPGIDFNLFIVNPRKLVGRINGLFMSYHQAMRVKTFNDFVVGKFRESQLASQKDHIAKNGGKRNTAAVKTAKRLFPAEMDAVMKVRPGTLVQWVEKMHKVKSVEYRVMATASDEARFNDFGDVVKYEDRTVVFGIATTSKIKQAIKDVIRRWGNNLPKFGYISGKNEDDHDVRLPFEDAPDVYDELEYDEVVNARFIKTSAIQDSNLIRHMVNLAKDRPEDFGDPP